MLLTKGAIGNLINRYRAVLKKCHLMNVFGSIALTGMLVGGMVSPVCGASISDSVWSGAATISSGDTFSGSATAVADTLTIVNGGALTISGGSNHAYVKGAITLQSGGTLTLSGSYGLIGTDGASGESAVEFSGSAFDMNGGTLNINGSQIQTGAVTISDGTINISGKIGSGAHWNDGAMLGAVADGTTSSTPEQIAAATFTLADGTLTLGDYGQVFGGVVTLQGGKIKMQGSGASGASIVRAYGGDSGGMLTINGTELSVEAGKYGILAADKMVLESGAISVASGGHLAVVGNLKKGSGNSAVVLSGSHFNSGTLEIKGGDLTVDKGGTLAAPKLAVTQNSGSVTVNGTFNGDIASVGGSSSYSGSSYTLNGGTLTVSGDMQVGNLKITGGEATVAGATAPSNWDNGTMLGGYGVGNNNTTEITGGTITVGDYGVFFAGQDQPGSGSLSFTGGTLSLNGSSKEAAGILLVSNGSGASGGNWINTFDISDNAVLKVDSGKFGVLIADETNMNGGTFTVDGALTMAPSAAKHSGSGQTIAQAITSGGSNTIYKTNGSFTQTGGDLKVTGSLLAEKINYTLSGSGKADLSAGNTVFKTVTIENEGLTVNKINVVASGGAVEASGAADTLTTSKLTVGNTGLVDITGNGSLQNVAANGSDQGVFVNNGGIFKADYEDLFDASGGLATNVSQFSGANGGLVSIVNTDNAIKFKEISKYTTALFVSGSSGGISFSNITVESSDLIQSGAAAGTLDVQNMLPGTVVTNYDIGIQSKDTTSGASGTNATVNTKNNLIGGDALVVAQASGASGGNAEVTVSGSGGLTLLQGTDNGGNLIEVRDASGAYVPGTTNVTVADNSALNIGMAGTSGKGTLNGDVTLGSGSALNITGTSGSEYTVGDVTGASGSTSISNGVTAQTGDIDVKDVTVNSTAMANTGKITVEDLNVAGAKINASGDITVRQNAKLSDAAIVATATDTSSGNVSLSGNATLGNTTVEADGAVNLSADLTFAAADDKKLANSSFTAGNGLTIGQGLTTYTSGGTPITIAQENVTYTAHSGDVTVKGSEVMAGSSGGLGIIAQSGDINAGGASFSTKGGSLTLSAGGDIAALSIDGTSGTTVVRATTLNLTNSGSASLTLDTAESMAMVSTLAASGDVTLGNGATLSATGTGSGAASTIEGELTVSEGSRADFGDVTLKDDVLISDGSAVQVAGEATLASGADVLLSESSLTANALTTNGGTVAVGNENDTVGSTLVIGTLKATNTVFIADPNTDIAQSSFIHVNSVDMTTSGGNTLLAGNAGVVSLGSHDRTWVNAQIAASGLKPTAVFATDMKGIDLDHYAVAAGDKYTTLTVSGSTSYADGYSSVTANYQGLGAQKLALQSGSLTVIDRTNMAANEAVFTSTAGTGAFISEGASFRLVSDTGLKARENYVLATDLNDVSQEHTASVDGALAFTDAAQQLSTDNRMVSLDGLNYDRTNGVLTMRTGLISASSVLPKLDGDLAALLDSIAVHKGFDERSSNAGIRFLSRALNPDRLGKDEAAATIEGAARMSAVAAVPQMTMNVADAASTAALSRTTFGSPLQDGRQAVAMVKDENGQWQAESGLNAGGVQNNGAALWIMPMYRNMNGFGFKAGEFTTGYTGNFGGVALGADVTFADAFRAGLTFNIGGGYAQSNGDFNSTDNDFNFWGIGAYGGWSQNNVGLTADVNYTSTYNKLSQELPSAMDMGDLKADVEAWAISAGLRGEYKFQTSVMDLIPHVGVRYMSLNTRDYDIKSGGKVFKADSSQQNIWTFPVGVTLSKDVKNDNGWIFKPSLDLAVVPAAGDVKNRTTVKVPGVGASADMSTRIMDDVTFQGGLGLNLQKDNLSMGVNYTLQASEHTTDHGVFATFRYEF